MSKKKSLASRALSSYKKGVDNRVAKSRKKLQLVKFFVPGLGVVLDEIFEAYEYLSKSDKKAFHKLATKKAKEKFLIDRV